MPSHRRVSPAKDPRKAMISAVADPDLPADWGKIDGEEHPDTVIANMNWNAGVDASLKLMAKWFSMSNKNAKACRDEMRALRKYESSYRDIRANKPKKLEQK